MTESPFTLESAEDWTTAPARFVVTQCPACHQRWYLRRNNCPKCGCDTPQFGVASPSGTVVASTIVHRPPPPFTGEPYAIVLVDLIDGVRVMGRSDLVTKPGDHVTAYFVGDPGIPHFTTNRTL